MIMIEKQELKEKSLPATRVTENQLSIISERAKLHKCTVSEYIRFCIEFEMNNNN